IVLLYECRRNVHSARRSKNRRSKLRRIENHSDVVCPCEILQRFAYVIVDRADDFGHATLVIGLRALSLELKLALHLLKLILLLLNSSGAGNRRGLLDLVLKVRDLGLQRLQLLAARRK